MVYFSVCDANFDILEGYITIYDIPYLFKIKIKDEDQVRYS